MDPMKINENKIKLVTSVEGVFFHQIIHTPQNGCASIFEEKWNITKYKNKWWNLKLEKENKITSDSCNVYHVLEWENRT